MTTYYIHVHTTYPVVVYYYLLYLHTSTIMNITIPCHVLNYDKYFIIFLIFFVIASPSRLFDTNVIEKWAGIAAKQVLINITRPSKAGHYQNILTY